VETESVTFARTVRIYLGGAAVPTSYTYSIITKSANVGAERNLLPTAGDFDGDGQVDIAILETVRQSSGEVIQAKTSIFPAFVSRFAVGTIALDQAAVSLIGDAISGRPDSMISTPAIDLNQDGFDDLVLGASRANIVQSTGLADAGRLFLGYGSGGRSPLPTEFDVLVTRSITGSGDYVSDEGTGGAARFERQLPVDDPRTTSVDESRSWFRFSTLGDGQPDSYVALGPSEGSPINLQPQQAGTITSTTATPTTLTTTITSSNSGLFEFDLSGVLPYESDLAAGMVSASLSLQTTAELTNFPSQLGPATGTATFQQRAAYIDANGTASATLIFVGAGKLWRSDGTGTGTIPVVNTSGVQFTMATTDSLVVVGSFLYFTSGNQLWKSNLATNSAATAATTGLTLTNIGQMTSVNGNLFFVATEASVARLWALDNSTAGARKIMRSGNTSAIKNPANLTVLQSGEQTTL
ncbi:MAG: hypothetical protein ACKPEY_18695, partial [Planctomycetota bacterium]